LSHSYDLNVIAKLHVFLDIRLHNGAHALA